MAATAKKTAQSTQFQREDVLRGVMQFQDPGAQTMDYGSIYPQSSQFGNLGQAQSTWTVPITTTGNVQSTRYEGAALSNLMTKQHK